MDRIHDMNKVIQLSSLDMNLLVVFDALLKDRVVTHAARRVGLSQPAMSSALARLRKIFNDPLFVRTAAGMLPTPYAQLLAPPIQRACELITSSLEIQTTFDPTAAIRTFQFYMTDIGAAIYLPRLLAALADRAPQVNVKVSHIPEHDEQAVMASGDIDLAVGFFPELKAGFFQQRLYGDEFVCLLGARHAPAKGPISLKQFIEMRHALVSTPGTGHEITVTRVIARHRLRVALTIPHFLAVPYIVSQSDLIVIVPRRLASTFLNYPGIATFATPVKIPPLEIKQYWHERYHNDPGNRWMRALVAELFLETDSHFNHIRPSVAP